MAGRAEKFAWEKFSETGKIGYFLFYDALKHTEDGRKDKGDSSPQKRIP